MNRDQLVQVALVKVQATEQRKTGQRHPLADLESVVFESFQVPDQKPLNESF